LRRVCGKVDDNSMLSSFTKSYSQGLSLLLLLWAIKLIEYLADLDLTSFGIAPGQVTSLSGILTAPLIHGSFEHLLVNTAPLLILGFALLYGYPKSSWRVIALVWVISGLGVWLFARPTIHIGASGLTHGMFFYLFIVGILRRDKLSIVLLFIAVFLYGGMVASIFPQSVGVSFEYHMAGAFGGVLAAILFRNMDPKPVEKRYDWEDEDE